MIFFCTLASFLLFYGLFHDFGLLVSVLVLFSECVGSSRHLAQSFSLQENGTCDALCELPLCCVLLSKVNSGRHQK